MLPVSSPLYRPSLLCTASSLPSSYLATKTCKPSLVRRYYTTHKNIVQVINNNKSTTISKLLAKATGRRYYATHKDLVQVINNNKNTAVAKTLAKAAVRTTYTAAGFLSIGLASVLVYFLADLILNPYDFLFLFFFVTLSPSPSYSPSHSSLFFSLPFSSSERASTLEKKWGSRF